MDTQPIDLFATDSQSLPAAAFDYAALPPDLASRQQERAARIAGILRRTVEAAGEIGHELIAAQEELEHGQFLEWVERAVGLSKSSAYRFMDMARAFGPKLPTLGNLPMTVVQKLSEKSTPAPVRAAVLRRIEAGETVQPAKILDEVREARDEARQQAAAEKEAARRAKLTPEKRAEEDARNKRRARSAAAKEAEALKERQERDEDRARQIAAGRKAAELFLEKFGCDDALRFIAMFSRINFYSEAKELALVRLADAVVPVDVTTSEIWEPVWHRHWIRTSHSYFGTPDCGVDELAEQMKREGQREPIIITLNNAEDAQDRKRGKYRLVDGKKRLDAASRLGLRTILAKIVVPNGIVDHDCGA